MQSAPASFRRRTDQTSSRSGSRPGVVRVVAGLLVRQQQAGVLRAALARREAPLGIEQDRAGVRRQHLGDEDLELLHLAVADLAALLLGERLLQRSALIHRRGGDDAALVRHRLHSGELPWCDLHAYLVSLCRNSRPTFYHRETRSPPRPRPSTACVDDLVDRQRRFRRARRRARPRLGRRMPRREQRAAVLVRE